MTVSVIEFVWVIVNVVTLAFTVTALFDARADRTAVRLLNGKARELAATGIVRREVIRVVVQVLLLSVALPSLFSDRQTQLSPALAVLMTVPVFLLLASFWDARDRKQMTVLVTADALLAKNDALERIETKLDANTAVSVEAFAVANTINEKLAAQGDALIQQGEDRAAERAERMESTLDTAAAQVADLHEGTAPKGAA